MRHLRTEGILATGLNDPVVPKGDEEIRFQISAEHKATDIDEALAVLQRLPGQPKRVSRHAVRIER